MLGKRPHQMQRTTSMSQLRVPPGSRTPRPTVDQFHAVKKDSHVPQKKGTPSPGVKTVGTEKKHDGCHGSVTLIDTAPSDAKHVRQAKPFFRQHKDVAIAPCNTAPSTTESFLDACYYCKRPLGQGRDIFIYRGDAAFCTEECRFRQISNDELRLNSSVLVSRECSLNNMIGTSK